MSVFYERFERHDHADGAEGPHHPLLPGLRPRARAPLPRRGDRGARDPGPDGRDLAGRLQRVPLLLPRRREHAGAARPRAGRRDRPQAREPGQRRRLATRATAISRRSASPRSSTPPSSAIPLQRRVREQRDLRDDGRPARADDAHRAEDRTTRRTAATRRMGQPLRMAELIAQLDGPVYVERVALFDAKQRVRAAKAIKKALRLQAENKGFSFVEVLAECPTHLRLTPGGGGALGEGADGPGLPARREEGRRGDGELGRVADARRSTPPPLLDAHRRARAEAAAALRAGLPRDAVRRRRARRSSSPAPAATARRPRRC